MVSYISLPELLSTVDHHQNLKKLLQKLSLYQSLLKKCDCLLLGCSHFNGIEKINWSTAQTILFLRVNCKH